ncbi:MAG TPA: hypothetical protein VGP44_12535 [Gemmatimonadales bacterium]|nr:hypothetical protein [Gemmatimonadales bacterium]
MTSPNPKCVSGRQVKIVVLRSNGTKTIIDTGVTSAKGLWAVSADYRRPFHGYFRVTSKRFGRAGRAHICSAAAIPFHF